MSAMDTVNSNFVGDAPQQAANPISLGYTADGPAASGLVDQLLKNMQDTQDRSLRASDTANAMNQNTLQQTLLNNPNLAASRQIDMGNKGITQSMLDSGLTKGVATSGAESEVAKNLASASMSDLQRTKTHAEHFLNMESMLDSQGPAKIKENWKSMASAATAMGMKNVDPDYSIEGEAKVRAGAAMARQNLDYVNKAMLVRDTGKETQANTRIATEPALLDAATKDFLAHNNTDVLTVEAYKAMDNGTLKAGQSQKLFDDVTKATGMMIAQDPGFKIISATNAEAVQRLLNAKPGKETEEAQAKVAATGAALSRYLSDSRTGGRVLAENGKAYVPGLGITDAGGGSKPVAPTQGTLPKGIPDGATLDPTVKAQDGSALYKKNGKYYKAP